MSVHADDVGLRNGAVRNGGNIPEIDGGPVGFLDGEVAQAIEGGGRAVEAHIVLEGANLGGASGFNDVLVAESGEDLLRRKPFGLELLRIEVDHDGPLATTIDAGNDRAGMVTSWGRMMFMP